MSPVTEDVLALGVTELAPRLRNRSLSPVELTEAYLERIRALGPRLNAFATVTAEPALEQARAAATEIARGRYRGPLHGVPWGAKDLFATAGIEGRNRSTCTSPSYVLRSRSDWIRWPAV